MASDRSRKRAARGAPDSLAPPADPVFVYCAFDRNEDAPLYLAEAFVSARSLARWTDRPIHLLTNAPRFADRLARQGGFPFADVVTVVHPGPPKELKLEAIEAHGGRDVVYLDGDTIVLGDIAKVFAFGRFDIAGRIELARAGISSVEDAVPFEALQRYALNSGVLFIRANFSARFAAAWLRTYRRTVANRGADVLDQLSLRGALRRLGADVMALPDNYNFRAQFGGLIEGAVFVVHAHYRDDLRKMLAAGLSLAAVDRFIDHVALINSSDALHNFPPITGRSLLAVDFTRHGWRGPAFPRRLWRALRNP